MAKYVNGYVIMYTDNTGSRMSHGRYYKKSEALKELRRVTAKPKKNKYGVEMTSYRNAGAWGGYGINNPRIKKVRLIK
jgi:hypothetical protein